MSTLLDCRNCNAGPFENYDHCPNCGYDLNTPRPVLPKRRKLPETCTHENAIDTETVVCDARAIRLCIDCGRIV